MNPKTLILIATLLTATACAHTGDPCGPCCRTALSIIKKHPHTEVHYGMIYEPGQPGHGQWHVQVFNPHTKEYLTQPYNLLPMLVYKAGEYESMVRVRDKRRKEK